MDNEQKNGNTQLNIDRNAFNARVSKLNMLGKSKKVKWSNSRRWRNV
jgi:hypothetical protein